MANTDDYYGGYKKLDYYTNYNDQQSLPKNKTDDQEKSPVYERKNGWIKVYNGHIGSMLKIQSLCRLGLE